MLHNYTSDSTLRTVFVPQCLAVDSEYCLFINYGVGMFFSSLFSFLRIKVFISFYLPFLFFFFVEISKAVDMYLFLFDDILLLTRVKKAPRKVMSLACILWCSVSIGSAIIDCPPSVRSLPTKTELYKVHIIGLKVALVTSPTSFDVKAQGYKVCLCMPYKIPPHSRRLFLKFYTMRKK